MKKTALVALAILILLLPGCSRQKSSGTIAATTLPVYEFTVRICAGTGLTVSRLISESVSCLHDYSLQVSQMRMIEGAETVILSGAGLEGFMEDALHSADNIIDASAGIHLLCASHTHAEHEEENHEDTHHSDADPHIWLSPSNAKIMAQNIYNGLIARYPEYADIFGENLTELTRELTELEGYGHSLLAKLAGRDIITFHDGFAYLCKDYGLNLLEAVEEESGSEAPASELIRLTKMITKHQIPAIFTEKNGSIAAAQIISAEVNIPVFELDMALSGDSYFEAMYNNFNTLSEALK